MRGITPQCEVQANFDQLAQLCVGNQVQEVEHTHMHPHRSSQGPGVPTEHHTWKVIRRPRATAEHILDLPAST
eukprot:scaffold227335_cov15-Tisochrysis_lutea.AAC.1